MSRDVLIRLPEVKMLTKLSRSTIYGNMKKGLFPKQYKPSPGVSAWKTSEINDLINGNWHD